MGLFVQGSAGEAGHLCWCCGPWGLMELCSRLPQSLCSPFPSCSLKGRWFSLLYLMDKFLAPTQNPPLSLLLAQALGKASASSEPPHTTHMHTHTPCHTHAHTPQATCMHIPTYMPHTCTYPPPHHMYAHSPHTYTTHMHTPSPHTTHMHTQPHACRHMLPHVCAHVHPHTLANMHPCNSHPNPTLVLRSGSGRAQGCTIAPLWA